MAGFSVITSSAVSPGRGLNLGLDLKGGMHLILQVDMDQAVGNYLGRTASELNELAEKRGLDLKLSDVAKQTLPVTLIRTTKSISKTLVVKLAKNNF